MKLLKQKLQDVIIGEVEDDEYTKEFYSHDASMFELTPDMVVYPKDSADLQTLVKFVNEHKRSLPHLSITPRSAGTDMSGGAIGQSIVVDFTRYFNKILSVSKERAETQPGVYYRDFEQKTLKLGSLLPSYPASKDLCTVGGMVSNNSGGEKSLVYGKTEDFIEELKVIFADGNEYVVKPLNKQDLHKKLAQQDYEGDIYRKVYELLEANYDTIKQAKPKVSKDSTGYHLWNVWDRETGVFDLTKLICGSQGTLGLITEMKLKLVKAPKHSGTLVIFLRNIEDLGYLINKVLAHNPETFEGFDNHTLMLSFKLFFYFRKSLGWVETIKLAIKLIPDALMLFRGIPKMVLLVEFTGNSEQEVAQKVHAMRQGLELFKHQALFEEDSNEAKAKKFWIMRRQSFQLLRSKVKDKHTAPFMDDLVVPPEVLPKFLPEVREIINRYQLLATIAGHMGDGNFHIIPLMKIEDKKEKAKLEPAMREITNLVLKYNGSLSGEHNDGMIRGPWLEAMYGKQVWDLFKETKLIFDPKNIFNPHKKTDSNWTFSMKHLREHF